MRSELLHIESAESDRRIEQQRERTFVFAGSDARKIIIDLSTGKLVRLNALEVAQIEHGERSFIVCNHQLRRFAHHFNSDNVAVRSHATRA